MFTSLQLPTLDGALAWNSNQLYTSTGTPWPAKKGTLDAADDIVLRDSNGRHTDYNIWLAN